MYGKCITKIQHLQRRQVIFHDPVLSEIHRNDGIGSAEGDLGNIADVTIAHISMVLVLHHLIAHAKQLLSPADFRFPGGRWIDPIPQNRIQIILSSWGLLSKRCQNSNILYTILSDFLFKEICKHSG